MGRYQEAEQQIDSAFYYVGINEYEPLNVATLLNIQSIVAYHQEKMPRHWRLRKNSWP